MSTTETEKWVCPKCGFVYEPPIAGATEEVWHLCPKRDKKNTYLKKLDSK